MKNHTVLYTADLHGNQKQYKKLFDYAIKISANSIIIGGDICPKKDSKEYLQIQRTFISQTIPLLAKELRSKLPKCKIYIIMGNDDCAGNYDALEKNDPEIYSIIHGKRVKITADFDLVGYSYVPITPFGLKDWEKYDLSKVPERLIKEYNQRKSSYKLPGFKTRESPWSKFEFTEDMSKTDSIQKDLKSDLFTKKADKTIFVFHTPPNDT